VGDTTHPGSLHDYGGRDLRDRWIAVVGSEIVDDDVDPVDLARRVTTRFGRGVALFASVVADRLA
jgi:hypothetical protein